MNTLQGFSDFLVPTMEIETIDGEPRSLPVEVFSIEKRRDKNGDTLRNKFDMGSCHCCDYIFVDKDKVLLLEDSNLEKKKQDLEDKCLCFIQDEESRKKFLKKIIKDEQVLKAYAGLLLLCRLTSQDEEAKNLMKTKKIHFWVIVNDATAPYSKALRNLKKTLKDSLGPLVSEVAVLNPEDAEQKLKEYADLT